MDWKLASKLNLKIDPLSRPIEASALDGISLFQVTHVTEPLSVIIDNHHETMRFHLYHSSQHSLILG